MEIAGGDSFFRSVFEKANDTIVAFGEDGIIVNANASCARVFGFTPDQLIGTNFIDYIHPEDAERAVYTAAQLERHPFGLSNGSYRVRHSEGTWIPVDVTASQIVEGGESLLVAHCRFSATPQMERDVLLGLLRGSDLEAVLTPVLDAIGRQELGSHMAITWPEDGHWRRVHTGLPIELCGAPDRHPWSRVHRTGDAFVGNDLGDLLEGDRVAATALGLGGYWIEAVPTTDREGAALITVWTLADFAEPRIHEFGMATAVSYVGVILQFTAQRRMLDHAASHDPLTGLANRKALMEFMDRTEGGGAVLYCDLDHFKPVNDNLGHDVGDDLLEVVARRLDAQVRADDVVARLGGDEFVIVCPGLDDADTEALASRIIDALRQPFALGDHTIEVGVSIGLVGTQAFDGDSITAADRAMYAAKAAGRGVYEWAGLRPV